MRLRLVLIGLVVLAPVACSDAADGLVDRAIGRWRCEPDSDDDRWKPYEIQVDRGSYTWFNPDGSVYIEDSWAIDDGELQLGSERDMGGRYRVVGIGEDTERIDLIEWRPNEVQHVEVEKVSDDEVRFREDLPGFISWTCRRR